MARTLVPIRGEQQQASQALVAGATATLITLRVPSDAVFLLEEFANDADAASAFGKIIWRIRRNGVPQAPFERKLDRLGGLATPYRLARPLRFESADLVEVEVQNTDGATTFTPAAFISGTYYRYQDA